MHYCHNIVGDLGIIPICTSCEIYHQYTVYQIYQGIDEEEVNYLEMPFSLMQKCHSEECQCPLPSQSILSRESTRKK